MFSCTFPKAALAEPNVDKKLELKWNFVTDIVTMIYDCRLANNTSRKQFLQRSSKLSTSLSLSALYSPRSQKST